MFFPFFWKFEETESYKDKLIKELRKQVDAGLAPDQKKKVEAA